MSEANRQQAALRPTTDVVQRVNTNGDSTPMYQYDAFGNQREENNDDPNPFRYCGEYYDKETETYYLRARNYDPKTGRFTSEDPHWNPSNSTHEKTKTDKSERALLPNILAIRQRTNLYNYGINNPNKYADQNGETVYMLGGEIAAALGIRLNIGEALVWDDKGNVGVIELVSVGTGLPTVGIGGFGAVLDADDISVLDSATFDVGGSISIGPVYGGYDATFSTGDEFFDGKIFSFGVGKGLLPVEFHAQFTFSKVSTTFPEILSWAYGSPFSFASDLFYYPWLRIALFYLAKGVIRAIQESKNNEPQTESTSENAPNAIRPSSAQPNLDGVTPAPPKPPKPGSFLTGRGGSFSLN